MNPSYKLPAIHRNYVKSHLDHSAKAIKDMEAGEVSEEFIHLSEIVFAVAGLVGGLGDKYARNAIAHAMHDGMESIFLKVMSFYTEKKSLMEFLSAGC